MKEEDNEGSTRDTATSPLPQLSEEDDDEPPHCLVTLKDRNIGRQCNYEGLSQGLAHDDRGSLPNTELAFVGADAALVAQTGKRLLLLAARLA